MLEISIEGQPVDLDPSAAINVTSVSPIFDKDAVDRKFSFPFQLPQSPRNRQLRRHAQRLDAAFRAGDRPAQIRFAGNLLLTGKMRQTSVSDGREEVSVTNDPLEIWKKLEKIKINTLLETLDLTVGQDPPVWEFGMAVLGNYQITIDGAIFSQSVGSFPEIQTAGEAFSNAINITFPGMATFNTGSSRLELDAFLVEQHPVEAFNLFVIDDYLNVGLFYFKSVAEHIVAANNSPTATHCFPMLKWDGFYGDKNHQWAVNYGVTNNCIDGTLLENLTMAPDDEDLRWWNTVVPCVRIPYILNKIAEALGDYVWDGAVWDDADFQSIVHVSNLSLDLYREDLYSDLNRYKKNVFKPEIILNNHVPDITAAELINTLCNTFSLRLQSAEGVLSFMRSRTPMTIKPLELTNRIGKTYQIEPNTVRGWRLAMKTSPNELHATSPQLDPVQHLDGEYEILTATTFAMNDSVRVSPTQFARCPQTKQPGKSPAYDTGANKSTMPLTLLFDHGLQIGRNVSDVAFEYLHASSDGINYDEEEVGAYSLSPSGLRGLFEQWHKGVIEYYTADQLNVTAYLHPGEIQQLVSWNAGRITFYHPEGGTVTAAVKSVVFTCDVSGIRPSRLELLYL